MKLTQLRIRKQPFTCPDTQRRTGNCILSIGISGISVAHTSCYEPKQSNYRLTVLKLQTHPDLEERAKLMLQGSSPNYNLNTLHAFVVD